ncbi:hypothetical protein HTZ84_05280 [Haloterrigena sp. SYSU A558-1]|uniref:Uncharacterized protein n=1 Tax=Haloterrigena gelatinilytica TaxID=2741724 RepID=A0ABX2L7K7_9EURY|nr:hypothetical protein [Haloterrigena gelatinilytica]NUC71726.1 hypothetical protein [Haloterrigena gelatinilytica]
MSLPNLSPLQESLEDRIDELNKIQNQAEKEHRGDGSDPAVWEKVDPKIRRGVVKNCLNELGEVDEMTDLLRILAEWRRQELDEWVFKRNNSQTKNERRRIKRHEIGGWTEELVDLIPESEFESCWRCDSNKLPKRHRGRKTGYTWECSNC